MPATQQRAREQRPATKGPVYVYGVARTAPASGRGPGVADSKVVTLEHGDLVALVSRVPHETLRAKRRDLLRHSDVLQQAFADDTIVPLRFGTVFPSASAAVDEFLAPRHDELRALLERFDGLGELRLRVYYDEEAVLAEIVRENRSIARLRESTRSAGAHDPRLVQLGEAVARALAAKRHADARALVSTLSADARDVHLEEPQTDLEVLRASFLVRRRDVKAFDARVEAIAASESGRLRFKYTGPVPPHSFVGLSPERRG